MRQVMTNLERFRADALKMPQIFGQPPEMSRQGAQDAGNGGGPVYGAGAKSAGSINGPDRPSKSKGQTTLTGKNPFTILKASAIASTQAATFPNNF